MDRDTDLLLGRLKNSSDIEDTLNSCLSSRNQTYLADLIFLLSKSTKEEPNEKYIEKEKNIILALVRRISNVAFSVDNKSFKDIFSYFIYRATWGVFGTNSDLSLKQVVYAFIRKIILEINFYPVSLLHRYLISPLWVFGGDKDFYNYFAQAVLDIKDPDIVKKILEIIYNTLGNDTPKVLFDKMFFQNFLLLMITEYSKDRSHEGIEIKPEDIECIKVIAEFVEEKKYKINLPNKDERSLGEYTSANPFVSLCRGCPLLDSIKNMNSLSDVENIFKLYRTLFGKEYFKNNIFKFHVVMLVFNSKVLNKEINILDLIDMLKKYGIAFIEENPKQDTPYLYDVIYELLKHEQGEILEKKLYVIFNYIFVGSEFEFKFKKEKDLELLAKFSIRSFMLYPEDKAGQKVRRKFVDIIRAGVGKEESKESIGHLIYHSLHYAMKVAVDNPSKFFEIKKLIDLLVSIDKGFTATNICGEKRIVWLPESEQFIARYYSSNLLRYYVETILTTYMIASLLRLSKDNIYLADKYVHKILFSYNCMCSCNEYPNIKPYLDDAIESLFLILTKENANRIVDTYKNKAEEFFVSANGYRVPRNQDPLTVEQMDRIKNNPVIEKLLRYKNRRGILKVLFNIGECKYKPNKKEPDTNPVDALAKLFGVYGPEEADALVPGSSYTPGCIGESVDYAGSTVSDSISHAPVQLGAGAPVRAR